MFWAMTCNGIRTRHEEIEMVLEPDDTDVPICVFLHKGGSSLRVHLTADDAEKIAQFLNSALMELNRDKLAEYFGRMEGRGE